MDNQKNDEFFEQLLERNKYKIYRICTIYAVAPLESQDLFQEVVFQIWKSLDQFKGKSSIDTWVYKIAINVCLQSKIKFDNNNNQTDRFEAIHFTPIEKEIDASEQEKFNHLKECISTLNETMHWWPFSSDKRSKVKSRTCLSRPPFYYTYYDILLE